MPQDGLKELLGLPQDASPDEVQGTLLAIEQLGAERSALFIDDELIHWDDLTFREKREVRQTVKTELIDDEDGKDENGQFDWDLVPLDAINAAIVFVVRKRTNADYTLDEALDVKRSDLRPPVPKNGKSKRPTKARASSKG